MIILVVRDPLEIEKISDVPLEMWDTYGIKLLENDHDQDFFPEMDSP